MFKRRAVTAFVLALVMIFMFGTGVLLAQNQTRENMVDTSPVLFNEPKAVDTSFTIDFALSAGEDLDEIIANQELSGIWPFNPIKYAIRAATVSGLPANTIVLLLLLPLVVALIAAARHVIGLRGFGIFLPAALAVVFVATGPLVGIGLFVVIVLTSTLTRFFFRKTNQRQYQQRSLGRRILFIFILA